MKIATGATNTFWELPKESRQIQGDYPYLQEIASYGRFSNGMTLSDITEELSYNIPWDCFCGFGVFGLSGDVGPVFEKVKALMLASIDQVDYDDDLLEVSNVTRLALYQVPDTDFQVIVGAGNYEMSTPELKAILKMAQHVYAVESGANCSDDGEPIEDFVQAAEDDSQFPNYLRPLVSYFAARL
jgi:hypothetical protein